MSEMRNDGVDNLIGAITIAGAYTQINEVCLYFNSKLFRGNRSTKKNCSELDAFDTPNYPPLANAGINIKLDERLVYKRTQITQPLHIHRKLEDRIVTLLMNPLLTPIMIKKMTAPPIQAVVLQTYGIGNIPAVPEIIEALKEAAEHAVIVNVTSCYKGQIKEHESG